MSWGERSCAYFQEGCCPLPGGCRPGECTRSCPSYRDAVANTITKDERKRRTRSELKAAMAKAAGRSRRRRGR